MLLRKMQYSDIDTITKYEEIYLGSTLGKNHFEIELKNPYAYFLVALDNDKIVGYISSTLEEMGEILNFFVIKEYQNIGIGSALLNEVIEQSRIKKVKSIYLEVNENNLNAIALYKKFGFVLSHKRKNYYKDGDAYVLIKEIN